MTYSDEKYIITVRIISRYMDYIIEIKKNDIAKKVNINTIYFLRN